MKDKFFTLYNGVTIPACGFGTWQIENGDTAYNSTMWALKAGYRHIDTAYAYENEEARAKKQRRNVNILQREIEDNGLDAKLPAMLGKTEAVKSIVYISCNLATWARDLHRLKKYGFKLQKVQGFNMFPRTGHFEIFSYWTR